MGQDVTRDEAGLSAGGAARRPRTYPSVRRIVICDRGQPRHNGFHDVAKPYPFSFAVAAFHAPDTTHGTGTWLPPIRVSPPR